MEFLLPTLFVLIHWLRLGSTALIVRSQSLLYSPEQHGRQIDLSPLLPTNESFWINYEEGYFVCPREGSSSKVFRISRLCDGRPDCSEGSDELERELKCSGDCFPKCTEHGVCLRASAQDLQGSCRCDDGYGGPSCSQRNVNECKYRPCGMMAECVDRVDGYDCVCFPGFVKKSGECQPEIPSNVLSIPTTSSHDEDFASVSLTPTFSTTTASLSKTPSLFRPVSTNDVVDKVKELLGNDVRNRHISSNRVSGPSITPRNPSRIEEPPFIPDYEDEIQDQNTRDTPVLREKNVNNEESSYEPQSDTVEALKPANVDLQQEAIIKPGVSIPRVPPPRIPYGDGVLRPILRRNNDSTIDRESTTHSSNYPEEPRVPFLPILRTPNPSYNPLDFKNEELFLKEINQIAPRISREDPKLLACRLKFQSCPKDRRRCMTELRTCSLGALEIPKSRGKLWSECVMDHHMCIMNEEGSCMLGFHKCSMAALESLRRSPAPTDPKRRSEDNGKEEKAHFTLSFHFRVCVNSYLSCKGSGQEGCKTKFDACSLKLLRDNSDKFSVRTQINVPGFSKCIQSYVTCIDTQGNTCYGDYNRCTLNVLDNISSETDEVDAVSPVPLVSTESPSPGISIEECKSLGAPSTFGSFSGRPAISTADCVWDFFTCTKRYGTYPRNKPCCDARFELCCQAVMGLHGNPPSQTHENIGYYPPNSEEPESCSEKYEGCLGKGTKTERRCKLDYNDCTLSSNGITPSPSNPISSTERPINDIDLADIPEFLRPSSSTERPLRPINDIDLPQQQDFVLQNGDPDPDSSFVAAGEGHSISGDDGFMACLLKHFDCVEGETKEGIDCPTLRTCSDLVVEPVVSEKEEVSDDAEIIRVPQHLFSFDNFTELAPETDDSMKCVRGFFSCNEDPFKCKSNFKRCVDRLEDQSLSAQLVDNVCAKVEEDSQSYLVPHPTDCTKFYSCQSLGPKGRYKAHLMDCPNSTGFDRKLRICNFIQSLPRCRKDIIRQARLLRGKTAYQTLTGRSHSQVAEVGYLSSDIKESSSSAVKNYILVTIVTSIIIASLNS